jgi:hypothetical protein
MQWSDINFNPTDKTLRQFAGLALVVFGTLSVVEYQLRGRPTLAVAYAAAALLIGLPGLIVPKAVKPVFVGWSVVAFPIGFVVSTVVLLLLYWVVFTPIAVFFRLTGRDVLDRRKPAAATASHWKSRPVVVDKRSYFRQS